MKKLTACIAILAIFGLVLSGCDTVDPVALDDEAPQVQVLSKHHTAPPVTICHKFGTPAEKTLTLPYPGAMGHIQGHGDFIGGCGGRIIDADGTVSAGRGLPAFIDAGLVVGATLTSWPTGFDVEGLDWFDNDGSCTWTFGDDLHVEGVAYPGANRNALHDANPQFSDPVVLDLDGSFFDGQQVDVDLETGSTFTGCPRVDPLLMFFDADGSGNWDDGEDIVMDGNGNGLFD